MAYAASGLNKVAAALGSGLSVWVYTSTDVHTDVDASDYFSDGKARGMKVNDLVFVIKTTATIGATAHVVTAISSAGAATISAAILA